MRSLNKLAFIGLLIVAGCEDPYLDNIIEELGEEQEGFAPSDVHRPGQPCLACHSEYEGAEPLLSFGGTLFAEPLTVDGDLILLSGYTIRLIDSEGTSRDLKTNRCGNFFINRDSFDPAFPVRAELFDAEGETQLVTMATRIGRDGSCGTCHINPAGPFSPGVVFVPNVFLENPQQPQGCPTPKFVDPL